MPKHNHAAERYNLVKPAVNHHVNQHNKLIAAVQGINTLAEMRVLKTAISKIDSLRVTPNMECTVTLDVREYADTWQLDRVTAWKQLTKAGIDLYSRSISTQTQTPEGIWHEKIRWLSRVAYRNETGTLELEFTRHVASLLTYLRDNYTTYLIEDAVGLKSLYSWRLMEQLTQYRDFGRRRYQLEDFIRLMEAKASHAANFAQLRRWVIDPAIKELSQRRWLIQYHTETEGKKVTAIDFTFIHPNKQQP